jgi:IS66 C-terminal element
LGIAGIKPTLSPQFQSRTYAAIYTVIETCKISGVEPQAYIADVIAKIANDWPASR